MYDERDNGNNWLGTPKGIKKELEQPNKVLTMGSNGFTLHEGKIMTNCLPLHTTLVVGTSIFVSSLKLANVCCKLSSQYLFGGYVLGERPSLLSELTFPSFSAFLFMYNSLSLSKYSLFIKSCLSNILSFFDRKTPLSWNDDNL